jgi:hypothetical protein
LCHLILTAILWGCSFIFTEKFRELYSRRDEKRWSWIRSQEPDFWVHIHSPCLIILHFWLESHSCLFLAEVIVNPDALGVKCGNKWVKTGDIG